MPEWIKRWGVEMSPKAVRPGIWRLKDGGFLVRARFRTPEGHRQTVQATLRDVRTPADAQRELDDRLDKAKAEAAGTIRSRQLWADFAVSWLEERKLKGKIESKATLDRWSEALQILIPAFGHLNAPDVARAHIDHWINTQVRTWMTEGKPHTVKRRRGGTSRRTRELVEETVLVKVKPTTVNGWLRVLRAVSHGIKIKFELPRSAFEGIEFFEEGRIHTRENPNALPPGELVQRFLELAFRLYPQHYAMIMLGFVTGLRPSSLRPIRWKGPEPDLNLDTGLLLVRRSHSRGQAVMNKTKTGNDNEIALPRSVVDVLRWHLDRLPADVKEASDLLFPSLGEKRGEAGALLSRTVLEKPFKKIKAELGVPFRVTPKAMRRTFNDIARVAGVRDIITRSISGHQTEKMQIHYSTAGDEEQRTELEKVRKMLGQAPIVTTQPEAR